MSEREKVIFAIENCLTTDSVTECRKTECPFISCRESCLEWLLRSALALLKEQEEGIEPIESTREQKEFADKIGIAVSDFWCGACHFNLMGHPKFCPNCGKRVKWDD